MLTEHGPPSVLQLTHDYPNPVRQPGEVLVEVVATSVNPIECKVRAGEIPSLLAPLPRVSLVTLPCRN